MSLPSAPSSPRRRRPRSSSASSSGSGSGRMTDQCIICLEELASCLAGTAPTPAQPNFPASDTGHGTTTLGQSVLPPLHSSSAPFSNNSIARIAQIRPCAHVLHDECLREWSQKANSCPICRASFNLVEVLDGVGGTVLSEYHVEDKKQVAEFDPGVWLEDSPEEEEEEEDARPCPVCGDADNEDVLLLCDRCDAPYHTYCIGLDRVPRGQWFCMECESEGAYVEAQALEQASRSRNHRREFPRTQAEQRESRRRTRPDSWLGAWSRFSRTVHDVAGVDLDFSEDDAAMNNYRYHQHLLSAEARSRTARDQWRQRMRIAERQGARDSSRRLATWQQLDSPTPRAPSTETPEQAQAWQAFDRARAADVSTPSRSRKRKSPSATPELDRPAREPERKLKRPRTRRIQETNGAAAAAGSTRVRNDLHSSRSGAAGTSSRLRAANDDEPSFLSSLLREVETVNTSDVSTPQSGIEFQGISSRPTSPPMEAFSPGSSPSPTLGALHSPRAMSTTPPPLPPPKHGKRSNSPVPLSTRVEPLYPRPISQQVHNSSRRPKEPKDFTDTPVGAPSADIRQPRSRHRPVEPQRVAATSPARLTMSVEAKESANKFVRAALSRHWRSNSITKEQYFNINRDVSRMLYELMAHPADPPDEALQSEWEKMAVDQVDSAVQALA